MSDKLVTGTFAATGQSATELYKNVFVDKTGGATATVDLEYQINGTWYVHTAALADGAEALIEFPFPCRGVLIARHTHQAPSRM